MRPTNFENLKGEHLYKYLNKDSVPIREMTKSDSIPVVDTLEFTSCKVYLAVVCWNDRSITYYDQQLNKVKVATFTRNDVISMDSFLLKLEYDISNIYHIMGWG